MNDVPEEDFATRRAQLAAQIERQREELAQAYQNLEKPIRYTEYGLRGFGFIRRNPWIFVAVPAVFNLAGNLFSFRKRKKSSGPSLTQEQNLSRIEKIKKPLRVWTGRALQAYQIYRRVRSFLP